MKTTMKAAYIQAFGATERLTLGELATPKLADEQVLIKVHAAGVNPVDYHVRNGMINQPDLLPLVLGWDCAGELVAIGKQVQNWALGDLVFAYSQIPDQGCYAEYVAVNQTAIAKAPNTLSLNQAAGVPLAALTAWQGLLQHGQLAKGQTVLIHNGSGGVGSFAIQIAKAHGAYVIATGSAKNRDYILDLGADEFVDYQQQEFEYLYKDIDLVFAVVSEANLLTRSLQVLKAQGRLISLLDEMSPTEAEQADIYFQRMFVTPNGDDLAEIADLIDQGKIRLEIDSVFKFAQANQALALSESHRARGKIIIEIAA